MYIDLGATLGAKLRPNSVLSDKPMLVYLHSHSANRVEGTHLIHHLLPDFNLCMFDVSGSGQSEGQYVTLGPKESEDLRYLLKELIEKGNVKQVFF